MLLLGIQSGSYNLLGFGADHEIKLSCGRILMRIYSSPKHETRLWSAKLGIEYSLGVKLSRKCLYDL